MRLGINFLKYACTLNKTRDENCLLTGTFSKITFLNFTENSTQSPTSQTFPGIETLPLDARSFESKKHMVDDIGISQFDRA